MGLLSPELKTKRERKRAYKGPGISPIDVESLTVIELAQLKRKGWRTFDVGIDTFIVPPRIPGIGPSYSFDTDLHRRIPIVSANISKYTVQDFDNPEGCPSTLAGMQNVIGYVVTDRCVQVMQRAGEQPLPGSDDVYRAISEERGAYQQRVLSRDESRQRVLVTSDKRAARAWERAGGVARVVKDVKRSYRDRGRKR